MCKYALATVRYSNHRYVDFFNWFFCVASEENSFSHYQKNFAEAAWRIEEKYTLIKGYKYHPSVTGIHTKICKRFMSTLLIDILLEFVLKSCDIAELKKYVIWLFCYSTQIYCTFVGEASAGTIWDSHNWMALPENVGFTEPVKLTSDAVKSLLPDTRFIYIVREPTSRWVLDASFI